MERGARERHVRHVAHALVRLARRDQVGAAPGRDLPRLVQIQQRRAEGVDVAVARAKHPVVEQQPPLRGFDRNGARTDLHALPRRDFERRGRHHVTVAAPELHIGRFGVENIAERRMAVVARTREHGELPADLAREQHPVAVERDKGVLQLVERLEIIRPRDTNRRAVVAVAPRHVVLVADLRHARIVAVDPLPDLGVGARQAEVGLVNVPPQAVGREADVQAHAAVRVVAAENAGVVVPAFFERHDGRIENTVRGRQGVAADDRVLRVTPQDLFRTRRALLPRHIGQRLAHNFQCIHITCRLVCRHR